MSDFQSRLQQAIGHDFLIERELGGAGMSRVFVATERALQRRVVVKVLPPELAAGVNIERFRREIQLAAGLQHPHIVPLLSAGDHDDLLWFSMPFIEGESLRGALNKQQRLPVRDVVRILHDVVDALAYAHARGVVHRDIKPENILTSGMHAMVTDFGVAKALSAAIPSHGGTTTGMAIGTPAYMAPEQLAADPAADHRVDLYAVGLLAYELLTGHSPFTSTSPQATLAAQLTKMPEPPHRSFADIPESLSAVIMQCLEKDAAKRPASAAALLAELDALPPMASGARTALPHTRRRRAPLMIGVGALVVAVAIVLAQKPRAANSPDRSKAALDSLRTLDRENAAARAASNVAEQKPAIRAKPETVVVMLRDSVSSDGSRSIAVPVVISRAESLAIADAMMRKRSGPGPVVTAPVGGGGVGASPGAEQRSTDTRVSDRSADTRSIVGDRAADAAKEAAAAAGVAVATAFGARDARVVLRQGPPGGQGNAAAAGEYAIAHDELLKEVRRVFSDSMTRAFRSMDSALALVPRYARMEMARPAPALSVVPLVSPNSDGRTRVVVANFTNGTGKKEMGSMGRDIAAYLRSQLPDDRFEVIDAGTTDKAARSAPDRMSMGWMLRADYLVSGVVRERGDSLALLTVFTDVRGGRYSRAVETVTASTDPKRMFDVALGRVNGWLDSARTRAAQLPRPPKSPTRPGMRDRSPG